MINYWSVTSSPLKESSVLETYVGRTFQINVDSDASFYPQFPM